MTNKFTKTIALIAAVSENGVIGYQGALPPWQAPGDLKRFQALTVGKALVMGRKTWESIGKPLPRRISVVVSTSLKQGQLPPGVFLMKTLEEGLKVAEEQTPEGVDEVMVIGGERVYREALPYASRIYLTMIRGNYQGDAFFPGFNHLDWGVIPEGDLPTHSYLTYSRHTK